MAYKEPFVYSMSKIGEDCDEKTIGLEVMEVIWKNDLPTGSPRLHRKPSPQQKQDNDGRSSVTRDNIVKMQT